MRTASCQPVAGDQFDVFDVRQEGGGLVVALLVHEERSLGQNEMQRGWQSFGWLGGGSGGGDGDGHPHFGRRACRCGTRQGNRCLPLHD
ncbi:hypothetical protein ADL07_26685 [Streptomyces sp. NRRL F-4707]|nr:hypothetical protein ADL07_26685 [Streptomyces sp. NRRL F-4707]